MTDETADTPARAAIRDLLYETRRLDGPTVWDLAIAIEAAAYDEYKEETDAAMNFGQGFAEGRVKALREVQIDLRNASVVPAAGEDAVLCTDIDAIIDAAIGADRPGEGVRAEYQRFYDFVADADPAIVDAWHFTENNKPGGLSEQVRNAVLEDQPALPGGTTAIVDGNYVDARKLPPDHPWHKEVNHGR